MGLSLTVTALWIHNNFFTTDRQQQTFTMG